MTPAWVWGDRRFWIDETLNDMLALSDRFVAAVGHSHIVVWRRDDGGEVRRFKKFLRPGQAWFTDTALCLRASGRVTVCELASGELREREPAADDPELPEVIRDRMGYTRTVRWADGRTVEFSYLNELIGRVTVGGGRIAVGHGMRCIDIRDAQSGAVLRTLDGARNGVLSPDGRWIAVGDLSDRRIYICEVDAWTPPPVDVVNGDVEGLRLSPDGQRLLVVAGNRGWILRAHDGVTEGRLDGTVDPRAQWTDDGAAIVGPGGAGVVRWDAGSGAVVREISLGPRTRAADFAMDARGELVAVVTETLPGGLMLVPGEDAIVYSLVDGEVVLRVPLLEVYDEHVFVAPDGRELALVRAEGVRVVGIGGGGAVREVARADWDWFVTNGLRVRGSEEEGGTVVRVVDGDVVAEDDIGMVYGFTATSDGAWCAVAGPDGTITVRDAGLQVRWTLPLKRRVQGVALAADGTWLFAGGWDGTVHAFRRPEDAG
jgi:hypothetical protein